jgi:hypothetical protein
LWFPRLPVRNATGYPGPPRTVPDRLRAAEGVNHTPYNSGPFSVVWRLRLTTLTDRPFGRTRTFSPTATTAPGRQSRQDARRTVEGRETTRKPVRGDIVTGSACGEGGAPGAGAVPARRGRSVVAAGGVPGPPPAIVAVVVANLVVTAQAKGPSQPLAA